MDHHTFHVCVLYCPIYDGAEEAYAARCVIDADWPFGYVMRYICQSNGWVFEEYDYTSGALELTDEEVRFSELGMEGGIEVTMQWKCRHSAF